MKFKKFNKNKNVKAAGAFLGVLVLGIFMGMVLYKSHANFTTTKEFNVIQGKIPRAKRGDVVFAVLLGDEKVTKIPKKGTGFKYVDNADACSNGAQVEWNEDRWAPVVLNLSETGTVCTLKFDSIYNSITVDGTVVKEFPNRGDYQVNMGCSNVESASWDFNAWQPSISGLTTNSSCNILFKSTNSIITKITLDGNTIDKYPEKGSIKSPKISCTNESTGTWDEENWRPVINNVTNNTTCEVKFTTSRLNGSDPVIKDGLIPVRIGNNGTVTKSSENDDNWYDYDNSRWANAVLLTGGDTYSVGATIPEDAIKAYFVWIPKYRYKLWTTGTDSTAKLIEIEINSENTTNSNTECIATNKSGDIGTCSVGKWMTHPAFTSLGENVTGIWVGKFETTGSTSAPTVKPNIKGLQRINVSTMYNTAYNYKRNLDSHMMKNTEWGAMAYLTNSKYGRGNNKVTVNSNSSYITGCTNTTTYFNESIGASTTNNYSGIYDTSGGARDCVMGNYNNTADSSGFSPASIPEKYIDRYTGTNANAKILGDAIGETNGWNSNYSEFLGSSSAWFARGGVNYKANYSGVFSFNGFNGSDTYTEYNFRLVLSPTN